MNDAQVDGQPIDLSDWSEEDLDTLSAMVGEGEEAPESEETGEEMQVTASEVDQEKYAAALIDLNMTQGMVQAHGFHSELVKLFDGQIKTASSAEGIRSELTRVIAILTGKE